MREGFSGTPALVLFPTQFPPTFSLCPTLESPEHPGEEHSENSGIKAARQAAMGAGESRQAEKLTSKFVLHQDP